MLSRLFGGRDDGAVRWPKLKLTAYGRSKDSDSDFAIINGRNILVNSYIGEVKLVVIQKHGALVEYRGEQRLITVEH